MNYELEKLKEKLIKLNKKSKNSLDSAYCQKIESIRSELNVLISLFESSKEEKNISGKIEAFDKKYKQYF